MPPPLISLQRLIDEFFQRNFDFQDAYRLFGKPADENEHRITISPPAEWNLESVVLEKLSVPNQRDPFLSGLCVYYVEPVPVDFADLKRQFGSDEEWPVLKPWQDPTHRFRVPNRDWDGSLLLQVAEYTETKTWPVQSVILRRELRSVGGVMEAAADRRWRIVVIGDLGGAELPPGPFQAPCTLYEHGDVNQALVALRPQIEFEFELPEGRGSSPQASRWTFSPMQIEDFDPDCLLTLLAEPEIAVCSALQALTEAKTKLEEVQKSLPLESLGTRWQKPVQEVLAGRKAPEEVLRDLEQFLTTLWTALLSHPELLAFRAKWLGAAFLSAQLRTPEGPYAEMHSVARTQLVRAVEKELLEADAYQQHWTPPGLVLLTDPLAPEGQDLESIKKLAGLVMKRECLIAFSPAAGFENSNLWRDLEKDSLSRFLILCVPQLGVQPGKLPSSFRPAPGLAASVASLYTPAAWAFAALCAASQAKLGRIEPQSVSIPLPPLMRDAPDSVPVLEPLPASAAGGSFTILKHNKAEKTISLAKLSALNESTKPDQKLAARLIFNPLVQTINRLRYLHAADTNPRTIVEPLRKALQARIPDSMVDVDVKGGKLVVQVIPAFEVAGKLTPFKYDQPWPEPRS